MTPEVLNLVVAAVTAVVTALVGGAAYFAATRQNRLTAATTAAEWIRDLRSWSSEGIDLLAEASYYCPQDLAAASEEQRETFRRCRCSLSALVDRGRLLLPNTHEAVYGERKERAYRGYRHQALDALVAAEQVLDEQVELFDLPNAKVALVALRREFVSIMQSILDPASMNRSVAVLLRHAQDDRKHDPTIGGLLQDPASVPPGAKGLLYLASQRYTASNRKFGNRPQ